MTKNHLCIQLSEFFCLLSEIREHEVFVISSIMFEGKKDFQYKEALKSFFESNIPKEKEYDEITVSWVSQNAVLIQANIFSPNELESLFSACFNKKISTTELDYNRLTEASIVSIYEVPLWLKSFFIIRFPRVIIQHEYNHVIRGLLKNGYNLKIQVSIFPELMMLTLVDKNEVILCNSYEINHVNDIIYYLSFVIQQKELSKKNASINFSINSLSSVDENELKETLFKIDLFNSTFLNKEKISFNKTQTLKYQEFCV